MTNPAPEPTPEPHVPPGSPGTPEHLRWVLAEIIRDVEDDMARMEGRPFTGVVVAPVLGGMAAAVCALAETCRVLVDRVDQLEAARG